MGTVQRLYSWRLGLGLRCLGAATSPAGRCLPRRRPGPARWGTPGRRYATGAHPRIVSSPYPDISITEMPLPHYLLDKMAAYGDKVAMIEGTTGEKVTYSEMRQRMVRVASALHRAGLRQGDLITLFSPNSIEWVILYLATAAVGATVSAVNPVYTAGELSHAVDHSGSKMIATSPSLVNIALEAKRNAPDCKEVIVFGEAEGCRPFSSLLADDGRAFPDNVSMSPHDMVALPYSSGTTGLPKGVMLSHHNIVSNIEQLNTPYLMDISPADTLMCVLPMFHIYGQVVVLLCGLQAGATVITLPKFDPQVYLQVMQDYRATKLHLVPPIVLFLGKHPMIANYDFSSVQYVITGAAPLGAAQVAEAVEKTNKNILIRQAYGLTEASPVTHMNPLEKSEIKYHSVGPSIHNTECKVTDIETGETLGDMEEGELCMRGPQVMLGYLNNEEATAHTVKDGWLHSGDIGHIDEDGHAVISDRLKELIKVKGLQVAPAELEALLVTHPSIQDAAVIAKPDERSGEVPRAYVVLKPDVHLTEEQVHAFMNDKVAPYKQLIGGVEFRELIPKTASGKILRRELKAELLETQANK